MLKKWIALAGMVLFLMQGLAVRADSIWEPYDDSFYEEHIEECVSHNRTYVVNAAGGQIHTWKSPEEQEIIDTVQNGESLGVGALYTDAAGEVWGAVMEEGGKASWVWMEELTPVYDSQSFEEEYEEQLFQWTDSGLTFEKEGDVYFWMYPGAKEPISCMSVTAGEISVYVSFQDEDGRQWGGSYIIMD